MKRNGVIWFNSTNVCSTGKGNLCVYAIPLQVDRLNEKILCFIEQKAPMVYFFPSSIVSVFIYVSFLLLYAIGGANERVRVSTYLFGKETIKETNSEYLMVDLQCNALETCLLVGTRNCFRSNIHLANNVIFNFFPGIF